LKEIIKKFMKHFMIGSARVLAKTRSGRYAIDQFLNSAMSSHQIIRHGEAELAFAVPNSLNLFRANTFSSKEPETLEWIDRIPSGSVLWDIGANVGLYSCYAAKTRGCKVFAFEPSVFNLELLARNIRINKLVEKIVIIPLPLTSSLQISTLNMTSTDWGGALSTFDENHGDDGKNMNRIFEFSTVGLSMDQAVRLLDLPLPSYIKLDVDGIEHLILSGGEAVLRQVTELAIEVNEDFVEQSENVKKYCEKAGLIFKEKRHSEMFENNTRFGNTYNQIWYRP
jgi:FkbM family methyltransferase